MKVLKENNTHKAVKNSKKIDIISKGFEFNGIEFKDELLYSIPLENEDDLLPIFEGIEEETRNFLNQY